MASSPAGSEMGMAWSERVRALVRSMNSFHQPGSSKGTCSTFLVDGQNVGSIPAAVVKELCGYPEVFTVHQDSTTDPPSVVLNTKLSSYDLRSAAVHQVLEDLRSKNLFQTLREWRDECYEVMPQFSDRSLMNMERAATALFGVKQYGVHVNGYFKRGSELFMWIARRSQNKPTYPGLLDNMAAGGISTGMRIKETMIKECQEEACIPEAIAARAKPVGSVRYGIFIRSLKPQKQEVLRKVLRYQVTSTETRRRTVLIQKNPTRARLSFRWALGLSTKAREYLNRLWPLDLVKYSGRNIKWAT
ncbi:uncharacterized protein LOC144785877 isoform X4 [Lissotriton helveticus]